MWKIYSATEGWSNAGVGLSIWIVHLLSAPKSVDGDKNETNRPQTDTDPIDDQKCFKRALIPWMVREPYMERYRTTYREDPY